MTYILLKQNAFLALQFIYYNAMLTFQYRHIIFDNLIYFMNF